MKNKAQATNNTKSMEDLYKITIACIFCLSLSLLSMAPAKAGDIPVQYIGGTNPNIVLELKDSDVVVESDDREVEFKLYLEHLSAASNNITGQDIFIRFVVSKLSSNGLPTTVFNQNFYVEEGDTGDEKIKVELQDFNSNPEIYYISVYDAMNKLVAKFQQAFIPDSSIPIVAEENFEELFTSESDSVEAKRASTFFEKFFTVAVDPDLSQPRMEYLGFGTYKLALPPFDGSITNSADDISSGTLAEARIDDDIARDSELASAVADKADLASPTFTGKLTTPQLKVTGGSPGAGKVLTSDADGDATWQDAPSGGISNPVSPLHISYTGTDGPRTNIGLTIENTSDAESEIKMLTGGIGNPWIITADNNANRFRIWEDDSLRFVIRDGNTGIGTDNPQNTLHVDGSVRLVDGNQGSGKVLTSDANGVATWQDAPSGGGGGGNITCPSGFTKITKQSEVLGCMQNNEEGDQEWWDAQDDCFDTYGGRLPTISEWYLAMKNFSLSNETDDKEWTNDLKDKNKALTIGDGSITEVKDEDIDDNKDYRCWLER